MLDGENVEIKDPLFDGLTHDACFIQVARLKSEMYNDWEKCSELKKMLSLFEQNHFTEKTYFKKYPYPITNKILEKMINTLEYIAADPKVRRAMEEEEFAALDVQFLQNVIAQERNALAQKDIALAQERNALAQANAQIAELKRMLGLN